MVGATKQRISQLSRLGVDQSFLRTNENPCDLGGVKVKRRASLRVGCCRTGHVHFPGNHKPRHAVEGCVVYFARVQCMTGREIWFLRAFAGPGSCSPMFTLRSVARHVVDSTPQAPRSHS